MSLSTPVALLIFKRPDTTEKVFEAIRQAKPKKLLVIADGARPDKPGEVEKCAAARAIIDRVDWDCEVLKNYSDVNLGCGIRPATGIDWVFEQVEEAIILEDDTLPASSFFHFCEAMLKRYRDDKRVMHICGDNPYNQDRTAYGYHFSKYIHCWGWASWRRAWQHYDYSMASWKQFKREGMLKLICDCPYEQQYWVEIFEQMYKDPQIIDAWDYQWLYACWSQGGLAIAPSKNLISNLGFNRADAAHTTGDDLRANLPTTDMWNIEHPPFVVRHRAADLHTFDYAFGGKDMKKLSTKIRRRLSSIKQLITA